MKNPKRHLKTAAAKVKVHHRGERLEITIVFPADMTRRLAQRLYNRFPETKVKTKPRKPKPHA